MAAIVGQGSSGTAAASSSSVSAITWITQSGSQETRVYYQDNSGNIREQACSNGSWTQGNGGNPLTTATPGTNISANYFYQEAFGGDQIRLYFTDRYGKITEWCYSGNRGWFSGVTVVQ